jgi:hypothetical protein
VPKKKNAMALFEAISKSKAKRSEDMTVPAWIGRGQAAPPSAAAGQAGLPAAVGAPNVGVPPAGAPPAAPPPLPGERSAAPACGQAPWPAGADTPEPSQDVVTLSMTRKAAVLIVLGMVLVVAGSFILGRQVGKWSGSGPANAGNANNVTGAGAAMGEPKPVPPANADFVPNKYYLVIEELSGYSDKDKADAASIVEFCTQHGEPAKMVQFTAGGTKKPRAAVLSLKPHDTGDRDDAVKAEAQAVENMGKQYFKLHRDYWLSQYDKKTGQLTAWLQLIQ